jgi:peptide chain release factor 3
MADERSIVEEAMPGDIVGLYDPGELRIGDTLYVGKSVRYQDIPRFAPELFSRIVLKDPTRRKHLTNGLKQLSQEGTVQLYFREGLGDYDPYVGAVGQLQFEVLRERLNGEYGVKAELEPVPFRAARWVRGPDTVVDWLRRRPDFQVVTDRDGRPVVLAQTPWALSYAMQECKGLELLDTSPLEE